MVYIGYKMLRNLQMQTKLNTYVNNNCESQL
jgi:hypothetical protein